MKTIKIYTDGSCLKNPGQGGWAVLFDVEGDLKKYFGNQNDTTNNRMELTAALDALMRIILSGDLRCEYIIYSDSAYVVNTITKGWLRDWEENGWVNKSGDLIKNQDLWERVIECLDTIKIHGMKVRFVKVKGHSGNEYNEACDRLARKAAERSNG